MAEDVHSGPAGTPRTAEQAGPSRLFVKLYLDALETGFLAAISDRDWRTLCVLALHMDAEGQCYPSLATLARELGVNLSTASQRIQSVLAFRWQGQPVVRAERARRPNGTWSRQTYTVDPQAPLCFGRDASNAPAADSGETESSDPGPLGQERVSPASMGYPTLVRATLGSATMVYPALEPATLDSTSMEPSNMAHAMYKNKIQDQQDPQDKQDPRNKPEFPNTAESRPSCGAAAFARGQEAGRSAMSTASAARPHNGEAQAVAAYLQQALQARGMRTFPPHWTASAQSQAAALLHAGLSREDFCALIDWGLAHPFWQDKITRMQQVVQLVGQWQQQTAGRRQPGGHSIPDAGAAGRHPDPRALDALLVRSGTAGV